MAKTPLFLPDAHPIAAKDGKITPAWLLNLQSVIQNLAASGDVDGPSSSVTNTVVVFGSGSGTDITGATGTGNAFLTAGVLSVSEFARSNLAPTLSQTIPAGYSVVLADDLTLGAGIDVTLGAGAVLMIL